MNDKKGTDRSITRRDFIKVTGAIVLVAGTGGCSFGGGEESPAPAGTPGTGQILVPAGEIPPADGYLLVDVEKCQGCASCMLACSLIHEGVESLSLSRIQMMQDPFAAYPDDLTLEQCRQCVEPACVQVCPTGALKADPRYGNLPSMPP
jgi:protein NrfC